MYCVSQGCAFKSDRKKTITISLLEQRLRRWPKIKTTLAQHLCSVGCLVARGPIISYIATIIEYAITRTA